MSNQKPTIVIVGAGWHTPKTYTKLTDSLRQAGYEVFVPRLLAMNATRPPNAGLKDDTSLVHDYVESLCEAGRRCVVIMHSYGGQVGTNSLKSLSLDTRSKQNLSGGVAYLIYMAAFALTEGLSMIDKVKEFNHMDLMPLAFDFADDMSVVSRNARVLVIGQEASDEDAAAYEATFSRWNGQTMYDAIENSAWRDIPTAYIHATNDMTIPLDYQKSMVDTMIKEGREVETFTLETGHCPNLTETKEIVAIVDKIAAKV